MAYLFRSVRTAFAAGLVGWSLLAASPAPAAKVRIAVGDIASTELLHMLIAFERAREKGVDLEVTYLKSEDLAAQAVVSGQAEIGVGTPYALIQKLNAPVRMFVQLQTLRFFPIVAADAYKSWKDLDKQEIAVHARGSGTEAIMKLMAMKHGISYSNISYVPGSEVRAGALLQGNIKASILDAANTRKVMQQAPGKFVVLAMEGVNATDESLFANAAFLDKEAATADRLVEAILTTYREVAAKPETVAELRKKYRLLPDLPAKTEEDIVPTFKELASSKAIPLNGGGEEAAKTDFAFFTLAGQLKGEAKDLKTADFWDFSALDRVLKKIGTQ